MEKISNQNSNDDWSSNSNSIDENLISFEEILEIVIRRKLPILASFLLIFTLSFSVTIYRRIFQPIYKGTFLILVEDPLNNSNQFQNNSDEQIGLIQNLASNQFSTNIPTLKEFLKSEKILSGVASKHDTPVKSLSRSLKIITPGKKNINRFDKPNGILQVDYLTSNPKKGLEVLKDISEVYLQTSLDQRQKRLNDGLEFLNSQEPLFIEKAEKLQQELVSFQEENSFLEPIFEGQSIREGQRNLENQIFLFKFDNKRLRKVKKEISEDKLSARNFTETINSGLSSQGGENIGGGLVVRNIDQSLLEQILELENQMSNARLNYKENSSVIKNYKSRLDSLKPLFKKNQLEAIDVAIRLNNSKIKNLLEEKEIIQEKFSNHPQLIKKYNSIKQKLEIAKNNLVGIVSSRENFQLAVAQISIPWTIIKQPEISSIPISPNLKLNFFILLLASGLFSLLIGLIIHALDKVFHNEEQIKNLLSIPSLGSLPNLPDILISPDQKNNSFIENLILLDSYKGSEKSRIIKRFHYQETLRNLYSSIKLLSIDKPIKIIQIVSTIPGEGKSFINILFSKILSELDKKVLLIDCDLRKPQLHKRLGMNNIRGLSNFLSDKSLNIEDVVQTVPNFKNWDVITSGSTPPNATRLLNSQKMQSFIKELANLNYDLILFDTPPLLGISDSKIISSLCDGIILVVSIEKVNKKLVYNQILELNKQNKKVLGFLSNQVNKSDREDISDSSYYNNGYANYMDVAEDEKKEEISTRKNKTIEKLREILEFIKRI